jgi:WD40 repeat protein
MTAFGAAAPLSVIVRPMSMETASMKHCAGMLMIAALSLCGGQDPCSAQEPKARTTLKGSSHPFAFRADGRMLVSDCADGIKLWEVASGKESATLKGRTLSVAITSDGKTIAAGNEDGTITIFDVATGKPRVFKGRPERIRALAFSADGKTLVSGDEQTVTVWDVATGKGRGTLESPSGRVDSVLFSPDDKIFEAACNPFPTERESEVRVWDTVTLKELCTLQTGQFNVSIAIASDGRTLASGTTGGNIKLWNVATGKELASLTDHKGCCAIAFTGEDKTVLSASRDGSIKWYDTATGKERGTVNAHRKRPASDFRMYAFSPNGKLLATVNSWRGEIELWDVPEAPR